jgi:hypothetical protein
VSTLNNNPTTKPSPASPNPETQSPRPACSLQPRQPPSTLLQPAVNDRHMPQSFSTPLLLCNQHLEPINPLLPNPYSQLKIFTRFYNKPSPFELEKTRRKRPANQTHNKTASAVKSLSRFLNSALPAFSRFLVEMQSDKEDCCPFYPRTYHSSTTRAIQDQNKWYRTHKPG